MKQRKHEVIPIIYLPEGSICRIEELEVSSAMRSSIAVKKREAYAKPAVVIFLPFRFLADLQYSESDGSDIYWTKLMHKIKDESELWRTGLGILHHIEGRETAQKMNSAIEYLAKQTTYEKSEEEEKEGSCRNTPDNMHPNTVDFSLFDDNEEILIEGNYQILEGYTQRIEHTHVHLINLRDIKCNQIISARISDQRSLLVNDFDE